MNKPDFLQSPSVWTRASRTYSSPVEYGSAIRAYKRRGLVERIAGRGHSAVAWISGVILAVFSAALVAGLL